MDVTNPSKPLQLFVFIGASLVIGALVMYACLAPQHAEQVFVALQALIVRNGSWFYVLTVATIGVFVVYLAISRFGDIKLGPDHAQPAFRYPAWLSMLFAAGMGIGLMFFGVAEPLMHFLSPPTAEPESLEAVREAMKMTFFHWGFHAWAIYAVVALILGYFAYRQGLPLTLRSALYPLIGQRIYGWPGHLVDIFAVSSTVFGISTSLGFGASQINAGVSYLFNVPFSIMVQIGFMVIIALIAMLSVATGLNKGIRILSEINMAMALVLIGIILIVGPSVFLLQAYLQNIGAYLSDIIRNTFNLYTYEPSEWIGGWTIFYWGWWLAWAPFVGLFIARISYGRTLREFIIGVLFIPTAFTLLWMTVFGNAAIDLVYTQGETSLATQVQDNSALALFVFIEHFPFSFVLSLISILMVVIFFVTSCDSGAMVVNMLCAQGNDNTPLWQRLYWVIVITMVAISLHYAGGLKALQTMTIVAALPFALVLMFAMAGLIKALRIEQFKRDSLQLTAILPPHIDSSQSWRDRLTNIISYPAEPVVKQYLRQTVAPALEEVLLELRRHHLSATLHLDEHKVVLQVELGDKPDFIYAVKIDRRNSAAMLASGAYCRAEVHLREGGQDYDIMGWSKTTVINDVIEQFHKHQHFLYLVHE